MIPPFSSIQEETDLRKLILLIAIGAVASAAFAAVKTGFVNVVGMTGKGQAYRAVISARYGMRDVEITGRKSLPVGQYTVKSVVVETRDASKRVWKVRFEPEDLTIKVRQGKTETVRLGGPIVVSIAPEKSALVAGKERKTTFPVDISLKSGEKVRVSGPKECLASEVITDRKGKVVYRRVVDAGRVVAAAPGTVHG